MPETTDKITGIRFIGVPLPNGVAIVEVCRHEIFGTCPYCKDSVEGRD